jgi:prephenate dehydrogenase
MLIAVIGGTKGLGKWIASFLKDKGFAVLITGRDRITGEKVASKLGVDYNPNKQAACEADVVIISVPINVTSQVIKEVTPHIKGGSLLLDVTSVKEKPTELMDKYAPPGVEVLPTHPMFGPRIRSLDGQVIVLTPLEKGKWYNKVIKFLEGENARVLVTTPQVHDEMMSVIQGLTHLAYISIAATIEKLHVDVRESRKFASPIYNLMLDMIARIVAQNPYLAYSIQNHNRHVKKPHETFLSTFKELMGMIRDHDENGFVRTMSSAAKNLDDLESSLGRSDKAISALTEEIRLLKKSIGDEVVLRHIYSGKIHFGVLEELSPDLVTLKRDNKKTTLKLSNVEVLSDEELLRWRMRNHPKKTYDVSAIFPGNSDPEIISDTIASLKDVVEASVVEVYEGDQIPSGNRSITIKYQVINQNARYAVENLLKGFGGRIR